MPYNPKYNNQRNLYKKDHYKRIPLEVTFEKYEQIKAAADNNSESVNGYIKKAVDKRLDSEQ